ncbi:conserved Plasmodium protein, unknown function [Plasmodium gallinaceum]|uniref:Uncharacterized protein n=1 Tax=Plasmodium gallinaceum TaxID=5849 RepID=A0A1J1GRI1_PLAGA|nr:conserved Plasmodium protein, unknown function [Plasmodium gallinaceum]CRG93896.1 conserved Plasmodium protein, unknown function [Plasmodium gallinaceum]
MNVDNKIYSNTNYIYNKNLHIKDIIPYRKRKEKNNITLLNNYHDYKRKDSIYNYVLFYLNKNVIKNSNELKLNKLNDNKISSKIKKNIYQKSNKMRDNERYDMSIIKSVPLKKNYISNSFSIDNNFDNNLSFRNNCTNCKINDYCNHNNNYNTYLNNIVYNLTIKKKFTKNKKTPILCDLNNSECFNSNVNKVIQINKRNYINKIDNIKHNSDFKSINHFTISANSIANNVNNNVNNNVKNLYYQIYNRYDIKAQNKNYKRNLTILNKNGHITNSTYSSKNKYFNSSSIFKRNVSPINNICNYENRKVLDYSIFNKNKLKFPYSNQNYNKMNSFNNLRKNSEKNQAPCYDCSSNKFTKINTTNNKKSTISCLNTINKNNNIEIIESLSDNEKYFKAKKKKKKNNLCSFIFSKECPYEGCKIGKKKILYSNEFCINSNSKLIKKNKESCEFKNSSYFIELLLNGEKEAKNIIDKAYQNKKKLRKLMYEQIEEEIENFKQIENLKYEESYKKLEEETRSCEQLMENELHIINIKMQTISTNIIEASNYIIEKIINVDFSLNYDSLKYYLPMKEILPIHLAIEQQESQQNFKKKDTLIIDEQGNSSILHYNQYKNEHTIRKFGSFWTRIRHNK